MTAATPACARVMGTTTTSTPPSSAATAGMQCKGEPSWVRSCEFGPVVFTRRTPMQLGQLPFAWTWYVPAVLGRHMLSCCLVWKCSLPLAGRQSCVHPLVATAPLPHPNHVSTELRVQQQPCVGKGGLGSPHQFEQRQLRHLWAGCGTVHGAFRVERRSHGRHRLQPGEPVQDAAIQRLQRLPIHQFQ